MLGVALNEVEHFVPLFAEVSPQFTEIVDFYLPPEGCPTGWRWSASRSSTRATPSG